MLLKQPHDKCKMNFLTGKEKLPPPVVIVDVVRALVGGSIGIFMLLLFSQLTDHSWIMAPFGASCVLLFAVSASPLAQPRNVIFGHFIATLIGLVFLKFFIISILSMALSVGLSIALMQLFRCVHPPAGANPLVILLTANTIHYDWDFLFFPVLLGSVMLVIVAYLVNNFKTDKIWPNYGLALFKSRRK